MKYKLASIMCGLILATVGYSQGVVATTSDSSKLIREVTVSSSARVVKGSPYSAEAISESVQVLQDGNKITKSTTVKMFRDSEGRFRREGSESVAGNFGYRTWRLNHLYGSRNTIYIYDPVESVRYVLNTSTKKARRYNYRPITKDIKGTLVQNSEGVIKLKEELAKAKEVKESYAIVLGSVTTLPKREKKTESLGTKFFEGVEAKGTKTTVTIPANAIGNERPIETVYEKWFSKELNMIVYSRNYDPRYGEQIYRLVNIDRSEPDSSLFMVPSEYEIVERKSRLTYIAKPKKK